ncbi:MAG: bifunctional metallophosphatase/5'-nucleotidase [Desulfomonilaceae bacterium]
MTVTRREFLAISGVVGASLALRSLADASQAAEALKLTILYMNDPHAHYLPYPESGVEGLVGAFAKAQTVLKEVQARNQAEGRHTLLFMAGDLLMGTPFSTAFKGKLGVTLMNKMKFDAMTVGNHDFDYGQNNLSGNLKPLMGFPLLSANTTTASGQNCFQGVLNKKYQDSNTKIVIFGLTTTQTPTTTHPDNVKGLVFEDSIITAKGILQRASEKDLVIALTHIGVDEDKKLAELCPKVDVIIGGHSHTAIFDPIKVNQTIISQAGAYARYVGKLDLDVVDGKITNYRGELIELRSAIKEDREIASIIAEYQAKMDVRLNQVIGKTEVFLVGTRSSVRSDNETNLGRLIAYNMAAGSRSDIAILNGGAIRGSIKDGEITSNDVYTALPFPNTIAKMNLSGEDIMAVLQRGAELEPGSGGKLQTFGLTYTIDAGKVRIDTIRGLPFDPGKVYSVATNDFLAAGGDGYKVFKEKGKNLYNSGPLPSDLLINYIRENKVITQQLLDSLK